MRKRFLPDVIVALVLFVALPLLMFPRMPSAQGAKAPPPAAPKESPAKPAGPAKAVEQEAAPAYAALDKRNIFSQDGTYFVPRGPGAAKSAGEFRLLGIVNTGVRRAFIADPFGAVLYVKAGDTMDGLAVKKITDTSVHLTIGVKEVELKVFSVTVPKKKG